MKEILLQGMHGLGDNLHQRAVVRQYLQRFDVVYLESSWVAPYWDMIADGRLKIVRKATPLRTQTKNAEREAGAFTEHPGKGIQSQKIWYRPEDVRKHKSVLRAMLANSGCDPNDNNFRMPVPPLSASHYPRLPFDVPTMVYRPLIERTEWGGCSARNPDFRAYASIYQTLRKNFYTVSVADLEPGKEWLVGEPYYADAYFNGGNLSFESLASLFARAALVLTSPGFAIPLAQAVGTPVVCVFGGYECSYSFSAGGRYLGIDPITPCDDFKHGTHHNKKIDMIDAYVKLGAFLDREGL